MERWMALVRSLCGLSVIAAVSETALAGRKGKEVVCLMLSMSGVSLVLSACLEILPKTN